MTLCKAYFNRLKCSTHRLNHLIPDRRYVHYRLRNANVFPMPVTRTDRYKNVLTVFSRFKKPNQSIAPFTYPISHLLIYLF